MERGPFVYFKANPLTALYLFVFIDLLAVGILIPLLPYYVSSVGAGTFILNTRTQELQM